MAEQLESFETYYKAFETTGCIDGVENCQYHTNSQIYTIAGEILKKFCEMEKDDWETTLEGNILLEKELR